MKDIFIIIPTLNPNIELFEPFLNDLKKEFANILIVNDGCRSEYDPFFAKMRQKGMIVFDHYVNLGKGRALKDAFNYLLNEYPNLKGIVTADSDGQHQVKDVLACAKEVLNHPDSLILGCRDFNKNNVPARNRFGNKTTRGVFKAFLGLNVTDTQTGLRGLSKEVMIKFMETKGERFEYETNQLIETISKDIPIKEIPISTIYVNGNTESHFNPFLDSLRIYKLFLSYIIGSVSSFVLDILLFSCFTHLIHFKYTYFIATVLARILSGIYNYLINAKIVFKKQNRSSFIKYTILCLVQMLVSAFSVQLLTKVWLIKPVIIKIIIDVIIFIVNFIIQRELVFVNEK